MSKNIPVLPARFTAINKEIAKSIDEVVDVKSQKYEGYGVSVLPIDVMIDVHHIKVIGQNNVVYDIEIHNDADIYITKKLDLNTIGQ